MDTKITLKPLKKIKLYIKYIVILFLAFSYFGYYWVYYYIARSKDADMMIDLCRNAQLIKKYEDIVKILPKESDRINVLISNKPNDQYIIIRAHRFNKRLVYRCVLNFDEQNMLKNNVVLRLEKIY